MFSRSLPIWKSALMRGAIAAAVLFAALELFIVSGKTTKIDSGEALVIALSSGAVYAALWSVFAVLVARTLAKVESRAKENES